MYSLNRLLEFIAQVLFFFFLESHLLDYPGISGYMLGLKGELSGSLTLVTANQKQGRSDKSTSRTLDSLHVSPSADSSSS